MAAGKDSPAKYQCNFPACTQTFSRRTDCLRHQDEKHGPLKHCPEPACTYAVKRDGRLTAHTARVHGYRYGDEGVPLVVPDDFASTGQNQQSSATTLQQIPLMSSTVYQAAYNTSPATTALVPAAASAQPSYTTSQTAAYTWAPSTHQTQPHHLSQQQQQQHHHHHHQQGQQPHYLNEIAIQPMSNSTAADGLQDWNWEGYL